MNLQKPSRAFILISVVLTSALLLASLTVLFDTGTAEKQIANSQFASVQAYNLAEGAIQHAVWRLKNDPVWSTQFISNPTWSATLQRNNVFINGDSFALQVSSTNLGQGTIIATSSWPMANGSHAQRVVKVKVFKALGTTSLSGLAVLSDDSFTAQFIAIVNVAVGGLHTNSHLHVSWWSNVQVQATTSAVGSITISNGSTLTSPVIRSNNNPPRPDAINMPQVDFNVSQTTSLKSRAQAAGQVYTEAAFADLMYQNRNNPDGLVLNGINYVTGQVDVKKGYKLTINGVLAADGQIKIGNTYVSGSNYSQVTVNHTAGQPSGLFSMGQINVGLYTTVFNITGVVYANDSFTIFQIAQNANVTGAIIARSVDLSSPIGPFTIIKDDQIISESLGIPQFSPVISVEHWEEEY